MDERQRRIRVTRGRIRRDLIQPELGQRRAAAARLGGGAGARRRGSVGRVGLGDEALRTRQEGKERARGVCWNCMSPARRLGMRMTAWRRDISRLILSLEAGTWPAAGRRVGAGEGEASRGGALGLARQGGDGEEGKRRSGLVARGALLSGDVWRREGRRRSDRWELGIGRWVRLGLGGVLVGCGNGSVWLVRPKRPGWALSLSLIFFSRKELERRKEERVRERICACGQFSRTHKNELDPRKIEVGMTESLNSNSFDLNSNGLNRK